MEGERDQPSGPATQAERDAFAERVAICMVEGGLTEADARKVAQADLDFERMGGRF